MQDYMTFRSGVIYAGAFSAVLIILHDISTGEISGLAAIHVFYSIVMTAVLTKFLIGRTADKSTKT